MKLSVAKLTMSSLLLLICLLTAQTASFGQSNPTEHWKEFNSPQGGFSVRFPRDPRASVGSVNVDRTIVKVYVQTAREKNTYSVSYFEVPHDNNDAQVRADLLMGMRNFIIAELKGTLVKDDPFWLDKNEGRLFQISIPKRGLARVIVVITETRMYRVTAIPEKPDDSQNGTESVASAEALSYLKSFKLTEIDSEAGGEVDRYIRQHPEVAQYAFKKVKLEALNGRAIFLAKPDYPTPARMAQAVGTVIVRAIIDEQGNVIAAQAETGHESLKVEAVKAARRSRFTPTVLNGQPVKVMGQIVYNFVPR